MMLHTHARVAPSNRSSPHRGSNTSALLERRIHRLTSHIEGALGREILPRLAEGRLVPDQTEVERIARLAIAGNAEAILASVKSRRQLGETPERLCLVTLTTIARELGRWWEEDRCGFVEVTLGMLALQTVLRELAPSLASGPVGSQRRTALMLPMPGEQHSFGISMVAEFFRAGGWHVAQAAGASEQDIKRRVSREWFGVVALSCGVSDRLPALPGLIASIRAHSFNPDVAVMVGGAAFHDEAASAAAAGADATASDAAEALRRAEGLVSLMAGHP
jgi:MerR family transcriptional regulator, light-induced transcriptional regulator